MIHNSILSFALLLALLAAPAPALAVTAQEMLDDPAMEARAREISKELRCLVCQNQSIDDSNAQVAIDLRRTVRERLLAGDTDDQVIGFVHARYGDFVLLKPPVRPETYLLWAAPVIALATGLFLAAGAVRRRRVATAAPAPLSAEEEARLAALLDERRRGD